MSHTRTSNDGIKGNMAISKLLFLPTNNGHTNNGHLGNCCHDLVVTSNNVIFPLWLVKQMRFPSIICTWENMEKIVFMENRLIRLLKEKMLISKTRRLVYYFWKWKENNSFSPNYFQVPTKFLLIAEDQM